MTPDEKLRRLLRRYTETRDPQDAVAAVHELLRVDPDLAGVETEETPYDRWALKEAMAQWRSRRQAWITGAVDDSGLNDSLMHKSPPDGEPLG